jgi:hypothetical protein
MIPFWRPQPVDRHMRPYLYCMIGIWIVVTGVFYLIATWTVP